MKKTILILSLLIFNISNSQVTFKVDNFSKQYFGKLFIADTTEVFSPGWTAIYDKKTKKRLIKVNSSELTFSLHNGKVLANIHELRYGEQSQIIYEDFNFDGKKDFAIMNGQESCYHGPSFLIYMATNKGFKLNDAFTALAQENCGMFDTDTKNKLIKTFTKSGCCWHSDSEYKVVNGNLKIVKEFVRDQTGFPFSTNTETKYIGKKIITKYSRELEISEKEELFTFEIEEKQKRIIFFGEEKSELNYIVLGKNDNGEFAFPSDSDRENPNFYFDSAVNTLSFKNKNTVYTVFMNPEKLGIGIQTNDKKSFWKGNAKTINGSFENILKQEFANIITSVHLK